MKKHISSAFFTLLILISFQIQAQDKPAPDYLIRHTFPDSTKSILLHHLDGTNTTFGEVLAQLKGKKVVIDFWASWCKDCIVSLPELRALKEKSGEKVYFLMLSVDQDADKWKTAIQKFEIPGDHYRIEAGWKNALTNYIDLDWVPRYVVLDKDGKVLLPKSVKADDESLLHSATK